MNKTNPDSELLREGYKSYHKAVFAVMEFRREAGKTIRTVMEERAPELAAAMKLDKDELVGGISPYTMPDKLTQKYDGSHAEIGIRIPRNWDSKWLIYFYVWIGDHDEPTLRAQVTVKNPLSAFEKLAVSCKELECDGNAVWIWEIVPSDGSRDLGTVCNSLLDRWIAVWEKVGGLRQFLPEKT